MAVGDYSTTPGSNTSISGINIAEGWAPENVNNAFRQMMADIATWYAAVNAGGTWQPIDATLTALAGVTTAANKLIYATGSDTFSTTDITSVARTFLALSSTASMLSNLGGLASPTVTGSITSGYITIGAITISWRDHSFSSGSAAYSYGGSHSYSTGARAWTNADDGAGDVSVYVSSAGLSSATCRADTGGCSGTLFAIGW